MNGSFVGKAAGGKLLRMDMSWSDGVVRSLSIRGDFFAHPEDAFEDLERSLVGCRLDELGARFAAGARERGLSLLGLLPEDLDAAARAITATPLHERR